MKRVAVIGFLGTTLDAGKGHERWSRWRPSVALCQHEDFLIHRLDLIHDRRFLALAKVVTEDVVQVSPETDVRLHEMNLRDPWDFEQVYGALHDFARAYPFNIETEDYLIHITTGTHVAQICMYLLTEAHYFPARLLQLSPPRPLTGSQPGSYSIIDLDLSKYDRIASRYRAEQVEGASFLKSGIETRNLAFNRMIDEIERVAIRSRAPLLLTGPTGAGKSQLARRIFELNKARHQVPGSFIEVNCATLRGDAAMSTLFGHIKGAFTGATADRVGAFEAAHRGTMFLDEIGELELDFQPRLLRALENCSVRRVGSATYRKVDVRILAATNRDLAHEVDAGSFRADLFHRLAVVRVRIPALRERKEDIPFLVEQFLAGSDVKVAPATLALLQEYDWPGNVRELKNVLSNGVALTPPGGVLEPERLGLSITQQPSDPTADSYHEAKARLIETWERAYVRRVLDGAGGNVSHAARNCGLGRAYLHRLIKRYRLD